MKAVGGTPSFHCACACVCVCACIKDRKCVGILYPCVYVKLLQMLRVSAVLLLVSSTQGLLSEVNAFKACSV